jgi:hypothetical protein
MEYFRQTYDVFDLIKDVGGFQYGFVHLAGILFLWYSKFNKGSFLMSKLYY